MSSREVIRRLEATGWYLARIKGSHRQFAHATLSGVVTVAHPMKDVPPGTLRAVERQSRMRLRRHSMRAK